MRPFVTRRAFDSAFTLDDAQAAAVDALAAPDASGIYLWGPVGRGKTWLLDRYFAALDTDAKKRVHFHGFFGELHASYFRHGFSLEKAVDELTGDIDVLCFDEFHVHDIGNARLLARVLETLFARQITLVVTSNYAPDDLLPNPLFHDAFLPAIALLKDNLRVVEVNGPVDYRRTTIGGSRFATGRWTVTQPGSGITFDELCCTPKSTNDYLALIRHVDTLVISDIPALRTVGEFAVQRFSNLVDVLYDADVCVFFHSTVPLRKFAADCCGLDIDRMVSRLSQVYQGS